jgi:hypothetical protein
MGKRNIKVTLEEWKIVELKRIAKERGTSVSAMMQKLMVEEMQQYEERYGPLTLSEKILR